jgi:hypothetical protein
MAHQLIFVGVNPDERMRHRRRVVHLVLLSTYSLAVVTAFSTTTTPVSLSSSSSVPKTGGSVGWQTANQILVLPTSSSHCQLWMLALSTRGSSGDNVEERGDSYYVSDAAATNNDKNDRRRRREGAAAGTKRRFVQQAMVILLSIPRG